MAARPIVLITADWHAKVRTWVRCPELRGDSFRSITQIKDYALPRRLPLLALGDIFDARDPDPMVLGFLMDLCNDFHDARVPFYYVQGNHELNTDRPWLSCHRWPVCVHRRPFDLDGIVAYGLDWLPGEQLRSELDKMPKNVQVLATHQVWRERMAGRSRAHDCSFTDVPTVSVVASGDFHAHLVTQHKGRDGQDLVALSPGPVHLTALDEEPQKHFFVLHDDLSVASVPLRTRPVLRARAGTEASFEEARAKIQALPARTPDDPDKPVCIVSFDESLPHAVARLEAAANGKAHLFARPFPVRAAEDPEISPESADAAAGLLDFVRERCGDAPAYGTVARLLRAEDAREEVRKFIAEVMQKEEDASGWSPVGL